MIKRISWIFMGTLMLTGTAFADEAVIDAAPADDDGAYPVRVADRPLTFTEGTLNVDASFGVDAIDLGIVSIMSDTFTVGLGYGIMDDLQVHLSQGLTFGMLDTAFTAHDMNVGAIYRFLSGDFEMGASLDLHIPISTSFGMTLGLPMMYHAGIVRLVTGVQASMTFGDAVVAGIGVPVGVDLNIIDSLYVGVRTGFGAANVEDFGTSWSVPMGVSVGYTIGSDTPVADVIASFDLPAFATDAGVGADIWSVGLQGRFYVGL